MGEETAGPTGAPFWMGPPDRPLAARLHRPASGLARGAVVLCPAVGYEYALAHRAFLQLAQAFTAAGFAALRIDYDGTAGSWGDEQDPGRVPAWEASIPLAVARLRELGAAHVSLVGLRVGAVLAARVAADVDAAALVLWDPVGGRRYARELALTATVQRNHAPDGSIAVDGYVVTDETFADLRALTLPDPLPPMPSLALLRPGAEPTVAGATTVVEVTGQPELFGDDTLAARVPVEAVAAIVGWLDSTMPTDRAALAVPDPAPALIDGIRERFVTTAGMACTVAEPAASRRGGAPTVLLVTTMLDPRIGPSRSWVGWSRELAGLGFRTIRADLAGIGDSPPGPDDGPAGPYAPHLVADVRRLVAEVDDGTGVAVVGLCSGARNALDAAAEQPVTDLLLINPVLNDRREDLHGISSEQLSGPAQTPRARFRHEVASRLPTPAWHLIHRLGLLAVRTTSLQAALSHGARVLVVYAEDDFTHIKPPANERLAFRPLARTGRFDVVEVEADHALFDPIGRQNALAPLTGYLTRRYPAA